LGGETDMKVATAMIFTGGLGITVIYGVDKSSTTLDLAVNSLCDYLDRLRPGAGTAQPSHSSCLL
jgi:ABC-type proline/glycine betaine transport system permease subunit